MSPNQPKTPVSNFRLDEEDKARLQRVAAAMGTSMTEAVRRMSTAMEETAYIIGKASDQWGRSGIDESKFPIEAFHAAGFAYRESMGLGKGEALASATLWAVRDAVAAAWPIICEAKIAEERKRTLRDVIVRLEGHGVDEDVIKHFWILLNA